MSRQSAGFTLLELMVALVILGIGLSTLFGSVTDGSRGASLAARQREAATAAQTLLAVGRSRPLADGETDGDLPDRLHWHLVVAPFGSHQDGQTKLLAGHLATLALSWQRGGRTESASFETLLLGAGS